jgi:hypothetical protein
VFVEWNEIKERTNLEPTVADGRSSMRILRHYFNPLKGQENTPLPGDDPEVPNLILSYRPQLAPGEAMDIELLNIPDTASPSQGDYRVQLALVNLTGQVVKSFQERNLSASTLAETRYVTYADSKLAPHFILLPKLTINGPNGTRHVFDSGFPYLNISANELRDEKYCKIPLRDLPQPVKFEFKADLTDHGAAVSAAIEGQDELAFVEVLRNRRPIYSATRAPEFRLAKDEALVKVTPSIPPAEPCSGLPVSIRVTTRNWAETPTTATHFSTATTSLRKARFCNRLGSRVRLASRSCTSTDKATTWSSRFTRLPHAPSPWNAS